MAKRRAGSRKRRTTPRAKRPVRSRASRFARTTDAQSGWNPSKFALWSQRWGNPGDDNQTYPTTVLLRHPTAPFMGTGTQQLEHFEHDLQKTAHDYLVAANSQSTLLTLHLGYRPNGSMRWIQTIRVETLRSDGCRLSSLRRNTGKPLLSFGALRTNAPDTLLIFRLS